MEKGRGESDRPGCSNWGSSLVGGAGNVNRSIMRSAGDQALKETVSMKSEELMPVVAAGVERCHCPGHGACLMSYLGT